MEKELKVYHSSNTIQDICEVNGLCKLLEINDIEYELIKLEEYYLIKHEDFNYDEAEFFDIAEEDCYTCNSSLNKKEKLNSINGANDFLSKNISLVLKYYAEHNDKLLKGMKKEGSLCIGSFFNTKSIRASTSPGSFKVHSLKRSTAFLGWITSTTYITNDDVEINAILIPKKTNRVLRPHEFTYTDKETNEIIKRVYFGKQSKKSDIIMLAEIYTNTTNEYLLYRNSHNDVEIESIIFMMLTKAVQKPLPNRCFQLPIYNWSRDFYIKLGNILNYSFADYDVKDITARYILKPNLLNYHKLVQIYSKKEQLLEVKYKEDIINMYNNKVQKIHNNISVQKLGRGLSILLYNKKGFEILTRLYTVRTPESLAIRIREIEDTYARVKSYALLNNEEHLELVNLINTNKDAVICANAIISFGRVFYEKKADEKNEESKENITTYELEDNSNDDIEKITEQVSLELE